MATALVLPGLPGAFLIERGVIADYHGLSRFHYRPGRPATVAGVWRVRYLRGDDSKTTQTAAVAVLSWPVPCIRERNLAFGLHGLRYGEKIAFANRHLRTISRVIVHPVFRATGLATRLVKKMIAECPTPYIEALATMGWVHPFFDRAGMTRVEPDDPTRAVYYHAPTGAFRCGTKETRRRAASLNGAAGRVPAEQNGHLWAPFRSPAGHLLGTYRAPFGGP